MSKEIKKFTLMDETKSSHATDCTVFTCKIPDCPHCLEDIAQMEDDDINPQKRIDVHLKALLITMVVLGFMFMLWWLAEYYPRQTLIVMLTITSIGLPAMIYYLVYNALKK